MDLDPTEELFVPFEPTDEQFRQAESLRNAYRPSASDYDRACRHATPRELQEPRSPFFVPSEGDFRRVRMRHFVPSNDDFARARAIGDRLFRPFGTPDSSSGATAHVSTDGASTADNDSGGAAAGARDDGAGADQGAGADAGAAAD